MLTATCEGLASPSQVSINFARSPQANLQLAPSALVGYLVALWSWGLLSPQTLQKIVSKAKEDILSHAAGTLDFSEIESLSEIGAEGRATQNSLRDLEKRLSKPKLEEARLTFDCSMKSPVSRYV